MKKWFVVLLLAFCVNTLFAQRSVYLRDGIVSVANFLGENIPPGTTVAVFDFSSDTAALSNTLSNEFTIALFNFGGMTVVDRNHLDAAEREIMFGMGHFVDEHSAQNFGRALGAQTIVFGSMTRLNENTYQLTARALAVETLAVQAIRNIDIRLDDQLIALLDMEFRHRFTRQERHAAGFRNLLFGWGSFRMRDPLGGGVSLVSQVVCWAILISGAAMPIYDTQYDSGQLVRTRNPDAERASDIMVGVGLGGLALSWTWGFVRPHLFERQPVLAQRVAGVADHLHIGVVPVRGGGTGVNVLWRYSF